MQKPLFIVIAVHKATSLDVLDGVIQSATAVGDWAQRNGYVTDESQKSRDVVQCITLGSPLSLGMFKNILKPRGTLPNPPLKRWLNGHHKDDFVTLGRGITEDSIGFAGVADEVDIINDDDDKHSITHYLSSPSIAKIIHAAL